MPDLKFDTYSDGFSCYAPHREEARTIYAEIFRGSDYAPGLDDLPAAPTVIDVGANIGLFSIFVRSRYPGATILAVEPVPLLREAIARNFELHGVDGVPVYPGAAGAERKDGVCFTYYPRMPANSTMYPEQKAVFERNLARMGDEQWVHELFLGDQITVDVERLSAILAAHLPDGDIDLVKIDVEGAELDVLRGIDKADWERIRRLIVEVQDENGSLDAVTGLLTDQGFAVDASLPQFVPPVMQMYIVSAVRKV
jgi:FkbM family methyltransferase